MKSTRRRPFFLRSSNSWLGFSANLLCVHHPRRRVKCAALALVAACLFGPISDTEAAATCAVPGDYPTLQAAIDNGNCEVIQLGAGLFEGGFTITRDVVIQGLGVFGASQNSSLATILSGAESQRVIDVEPGLMVTFAGLTIEKGVAAQGAGIRNGGSRLTLDRCIVRDNHAPGSEGEGGGIFNLGKLILVDCYIMRNSAEHRGGGISNSGIGQSFTLQGATQDVIDFFTDAAQALEEFYQAIMSVEVDPSVIPDSPNPSVGEMLATLLDLIVSMTTLPDVREIDHAQAAFDDTQGTLLELPPASTWDSLFDQPENPELWELLGLPSVHLIDSYVSENSVQAPAGGAGGGIHNDLGVLVIEGSEIVDNRVESTLMPRGGGVDNNIGICIISGSRFENNEAYATVLMSLGGGMFNILGLLDVRDTEFLGNRSDGLFKSRGGGVVTTLGSRATFENCLFEANKAGKGGALFNTFNASLEVKDSMFRKNRAASFSGGAGGAIYNANASARVDRATFLDNVAAGKKGGGAIFNSAGDLFTALDGGINLNKFFRDTDLTVHNSTFSGNAARYHFVRIPIDGVTYALPRGPGTGGAIHNRASDFKTATVTLNHCTFAGNNQDTVPNLEEEKFPWLGFPVDSGIFSYSSANTVAKTIIGNSILDDSAYNFGDRADQVKKAFTNSDSNGGALSPYLLYTRLTAEWDLNRFAESLGGNVLGANSLFPGFIFDGPGDVAADPELKPLVYNGGHAFALTHRVSETSPAIGRASSSSLPVDQRGMPRLQPGASGAYEFRLPIPSNDSYRAIEGQTLSIDRDQGLLVNDAPYPFGGGTDEGQALRVHSYQQPAHGSVNVEHDGRFVYAPNPGFFGQDTFTYRVLEPSHPSSISEVQGTVTVQVKRALQITSHRPAKSESVMSLSPQVIIGFNTSINPATVTSETIRVQGTQTGYHSWQGAVSGNHVQITTDAAFELGEWVTVTVTTGVESAQGNEIFEPLAHGYSWQFHIRPEWGEGIMAALSGGLGHQNSRDVAVGDFDGNGYVDIVVANYGPDHEAEGNRLYWNYGLETFVVASQNLSGTSLDPLYGADGSAAVAAGDLDGDGDLDLVFANEDRLPATGSDLGENTVWINQGGAQGGVLGQFEAGFFFGAVYLLESPLRPPFDFTQNRQDFRSASQDVALGDLDGDGDLDIFVANHDIVLEAHDIFDEEKLILTGTGANTVWWNDGAGNFQDSGQRLGDRASNAVSLGDVDGDGDLDAYVANGDLRWDQGSPDEIWLNDGSGSFTLAQSLGDEKSNDAVLADLDADGDLDAFTVVEFNSGNRVWINQGGAQGGAPGMFQDSGHRLGGDSSRGAAVADLDHDGDLDLIAATDGYDPLRWWENDGQAQFAEHSLDLVEGNSLAVAVADLNGEGDLDIIVANSDYPLRQRVIFREFFGSLPKANTIVLNNSIPRGVPDAFELVEDGSRRRNVLVNDFLPDRFHYTVSFVTETVVHHFSSYGQLISHPFEHGIDFDHVVYSENGVEYHEQVPLTTQHGALEWDEIPGIFTYTPDPNFHGTDQFTYMVSHPLASSEPTIVTFTVQSVNDAPVAAPDYHYPHPNGASVQGTVSVLANDKDVEGDALEAVLAQGPSSGSVNLSPDGTFVYQPSPGRLGTDAFSYFATDGEAQSSATRVKLGNTPPVANPDIYPVSSDVDALITIDVNTGVLANDGDADGDPLTIVLKQAPVGMEVFDLNAETGALQYRLGAGFPGSAVAVYAVTDDVVESAPARIKIGNVPPVAHDDSGFEVLNERVLSVSNGILENDSDADGDPLTAELVSGPANGALILEPDGSFEYVPNPETFGPDSFTYRATDTFDRSEPATVSILVKDPLKVVSSSPAPHALGVPGSTTVSIEFDQDVDFDSLEGRIAANGSLSGHAEPAPDLQGSTLSLSFAEPFETGETVTVTLSPGITGPRPAELEFAVVWQFQIETQSGDAVFAAASQEIGHDKTTDAAMGDLDGDGDLDAWFVQSYQDGSSADQIWFNDGHGFFTDSGQALGNTAGSGVAFGDLDGDGDLDALVCQIEVKVWLNDGAGAMAPGPAVANTDSGKLHKTILGDLDGDGDLDAFLVYWQGGANRILWNDGNAGFSDSGQRLGQGDTRAAALSDLDQDGDLDILSASQGPNRIWLNDGRGLFADSGQEIGNAKSRGVGLADLDGDGDADAFFADQPGGNSVWLNDGQGAFTDSGQLLEHPSGTLPFDVVLGDLDHDGDLDAFVAGGKASQVWLNDGAGAFEAGNLGLGSSFSAAVALGDLDGDRDLDAVIANGIFNREPNRVWINHTAPEALDDHYAPNGASPVQVSVNEGVLANDLDLDGDTMSVQLAQGPLHGTLTLQDDGSFTYAPGATFGGADAFEYVAFDGILSSQIARVKIGDTAPSVQDDPDYRTIMNTPLHVSALDGVLANDIDLEGDVLTASLVTGPSHGSLQFNADGSFHYAPNAGYSGADAFAYSATDGVSPASTATVILSIRPAIELISVSPASQSMEISKNTAIEASFSGSVEAGSAQTGFRIRGSLSQDHAAQVSVSGNTVQLTPFQQFFPGETVTVTVISGLEGGIQGAGGELLNASFIWQFTIQAETGNGFFLDSGQRLSSPGGKASKVALGDLDGDGNLDAVVADSRGPNEIWFNVGAAEFQSSQQLFGDSESNDLALADLDGDGDLDVFVGNGFLYKQPNKVWFNHGSGHLVDSGQILGNRNTRSVTLGDIDGDGDIDAVTSTGTFDGGEGPALWLNNGSGFFAEAAPEFGLAIPDTIQGRVGLGDVDGDGDLDAVIARRIFDGVTDESFFNIWFNNGSGRFTQRSQNLGQAAISYANISFIDADRDGDLDLLFGHNIPHGAKLWINDGNGGYTQSAQSFGNGLFTDVSVGDLNADGAPDLFDIAGLDPAQVWINNDSGGFALNGQTLDDGTARVDAALGDLDGDGDLDAFVVEGTLSSDPTGEHMVWLNGPTAEGQSPPILSPIADQWTVANQPLGPIGFSVSDPDTDPSLLVITAISSNPALIPDNGEGLQLGGSGANRNLTVIPAAGEYGGSDITVTVRDGAHTESVTFLVEVRVVSFVQGPPIFGNEQVADLSVSDYDENGIPDVFVGHGVILPDVDEFLHATGHGTFLSVPGFSQIPFTLTSHVLMADFFPSIPNLDILALTPENNGAQDRASLYIVDRFLGTQNIYLVLTLPDFDPVSQLAAGDLDGDNDLDIWLATSGIDSLLFNPSNTTGDGTPWNVQPYPGGLTVHAGVALADFDGDGDLDAFTSGALGEPDQVWLNDGQGNFTLGDSPGRSSGGKARTGDVDGDGDLDVLLTGQTKFLRNDGNANFTEDTQEFPSGFDAQWGDVDGDGDLDLIIARHSGVILLNDGDGVFHPVGMELEWLGKRIELADFDGDGDLDIFAGSDVPMPSGSTKSVWLNHFNPGHQTRPFIAPLGELTIPNGASSSVVELTLGDLESRSADLIVTASSSNPSLVPNDARGLQLDRQGASITLRISPVAGILGETTITVTVNDGQFQSSTSFIVTVVEVEGPPEWSAANPSAVFEDSGLVTIPDWIEIIDFNAPSGSQQSISAVTVENISHPALFEAPPHVDLDGTLTFQPAADATGSSSFDVTIVDSGPSGNNTSAPATFVIEVLPVNDAPSFNAPQPAPMPETFDGVEAVIVNWILDVDLGPASEADQSVLGFIVSEVTHPELFLQGPVVDLDGSLRFTPAPFAFGGSEFQVAVQDDGGVAYGGVDISLPQTFAITIAAQNTAPTFAASDPPAVQEDAGLQTILGWASFHPGAANEAGQSVAGYLVDDLSNPSLFALPPGILPDGTLTYQPAANAHGAATFSVRVQDDGGADGGGSDLSDIAAFTITVDSVNDAPVAVNDDNTTASGGFRTTEDAGLVTASVLDNDTDADEGDTLSFVDWDASDIKGTLNHLGYGVFEYHPNGQFESLTEGEQAFEVFSYTIEDEAGAAATAWINLEVRGLNDAPVATNDGPETGDGEFTTFENIVFVIGNVLENDTDVDNSDILEVSNLDTSATLGLVTDLGDGTFSYDPNGKFEALAAGESAVDTFHYTVSDAQGGSSSATVTIEIIGLNDAPVAVDDGLYFTDEKTPVTIPNPLANDFDPNPSSSLALTGIDRSASRGLVAANSDGSLTYTPLGSLFSLRTGETAAVAFNYTITDGHGGSAWAMIHIEVAGVNDIPVADEAAFELAEDTPLEGVLTGFDEEEQPLAFSLLEPPVHGEAALNPDGAFTYLPAVNYFGSDVFSFLVHDGEANSEAGTVSLTILPVNDSPSPVEVPDVIVEAGSPGFSLNLNDLFFDPDEEPSLSFELLENDNPSLLAAIETGQALEIQLVPSQLGEALLTVEATDGEGATGVSGVTLIVQDTTAPVVACQNLSIELDTNGRASIAAADVDNGTTDHVGIESLSLDQTEFNCSHIGPNEISLTATDISGNISTCVAIVTVIDAAPPTLEFNGPDEMELTLGETFEDPGATATDLCDEDLVIVIGGDPVDTQTAGVYLVTYDAADASGNAAPTLTRVVRVESAFTFEDALTGVESVILDTFALVEGNIVSQESLILGAKSTVNGFAWNVAGVTELKNFAFVQGELLSGGSATLANSATAGSLVHSGGDVELKNKARVDGDLKAAGSVKLHNKAGVGGEILENASSPVLDDVVMPALAFGDRTPGESVEVGVKQTKFLSPGNYGDVHVNTKATLQLEAGRYHFESLDTGPNALIELNASQGTIRVDVSGHVAMATKTAMQAKVSNGDSAAASILFQVNGNEVSLGANGSFAGTFMAPNAAIELKTGATLAGALFGQNIRLHAKSEVHLETAFALLQEASSEWQWPAEPAPVEASDEPELATDDDDDSKGNSKAKGKGAKKSWSMGMQVVLQAAIAEGAVALTFVAPAEAAYPIEFCDDLAAGVWAVVDRVPARAGERVSWRGPTVRRMGFYRVGLPSGLEVNSLSPF